MTGKSIHGHATGKLSPTYHSWAAMIKRCTNPNSQGWRYYGGRGITVCDRWQKFQNFLADMGERPFGMSLERKDNDRGYDPSNCEWADRHTQRLNCRRVTWVEIDGVTKRLVEWCKEFGISVATVRTRVYHGLDYATALTKPVDLRKSRR